MQWSLEIRHRAGLGTWSQPCLKSTAAHYPLVNGRVCSSQLNTLASTLQNTEAVSNRHPNPRVALLWCGEEKQEPSSPLTEARLCAPCRVGEEEQAPTENRALGKGHNRNRRGGSVGMAAGAEGGRPVIPSGLCHWPETTHSSLGPGPWLFSPHSRGG